jgi:hypothetical protein
MAVQIQLRRGTAAAWTAANPTLAVGELVIETDTDKYKIGDGSTAWTSLGYSSLPSTAITTGGGTFTGAITINGASPIVLEGATSNDYETTIAVTDPTADRTITLPNSTGTVALSTGNVATATALETARTIGGTSFDGTANITPANATLAATATALATARTIGGVSFDGTADINLPGVNATGNQNTSGTAATVTGAAQTAITSVGTMTGLVVDGTSQLYESVTEAITGNKTPALTDAGKVFYCSQSGGTQTITIDGSLSWPVGTQMVFVASNTSTVTFAESNSTSLDSKDDNKSIDGRYASAALINYGSNTWFLIGALA